MTGAASVGVEAEPQYTDIDDEEHWYDASQVFVAAGPTRAPALQSLRLVAIQLGLQLGHDRAQTRAVS